jgi:hypothetical protein
MCLSSSTAAGFPAYTGFFEVSSLSSRQKISHTDVIIWWCSTLLKVILSIDVHFINA